MGGFGDHKKVTVGIIEENSYFTQSGVNGGGL